MPLAGGGGIVSLDLGETVRSWAIIGSHGTIATAASNAHTPRPTRQLPPASAIGTVSTSAIVSPIESSVV